MVPHQAVQRCLTRKVSILAFADDLVLLAKDQKEATRQSGMIAEFLQELGMHLSIEKSSTVQIVSRGKTWHQIDPRLYIGDERLPYTNPERVVAYLGPWNRSMERTDQNLKRRNYRGR